MNLAGLAAGYGGIVEGEQDYADRQARNARTQQGNMENAIRLRQMREMDEARKAQLAVGRQAPEAYAPITPGTTGYADAERVATAAPAPVAPPPVAMTTPTGGLKGPRDQSAVTDRSIEASEMAKRLSSARPRPAAGLSEARPITATPEGADTFKALQTRRMLEAKVRNGTATPQERASLTPTAGQVAVQGAADVQALAARERMAQQMRDWQSEDAARERGRAPAPAAAPSANGATPESLFQAIVARESGNNDAIGNSPQGAVGPAQVMPGTFAALQRQGLVPADADIRNPAHNRAAGLALVKQLWQQFGGDPAKVAAAYIGGPTGVNPDGSLRTTRPDALGTTPAAYAQSVMAKLGVQTPTIGPGVNPALPNAQPATPAVAPEATYKATEIVDLSPRAAGLAQKRMEMLGRERQTYVSLMQASYDPAEQMKLRQAILGIDAGMAAADLTQLAAGAANGSREALVTLAQTAANQIGTKISVQDAGEGRVILTVAGRQQPPVTMAQAARQFHLALNEELQKTVAAAEAKNAAEQAKQFYQGQRELALENAKGDNARRLARLQGRERRETALVEGTLTMAQKEADRAAAYEYGKGQYTLRETADGRLLMYPKSGMGVKVWVPGETGGQFSTDGEWVDTNQG